MKQRVLSGMRPTGQFHVGYFVAFLLGLVTVPAAVYSAEPGELKGALSGGGFSYANYAIKKARLRNLTAQDFESFGTEDGQLLWKGHQLERGKPTVLIWHTHTHVTGDRYYPARQETVRGGEHIKGEFGRVSIEIPGGDLGDAVYQVPAEGVRVFCSFGNRLSWRGEYCERAEGTVTIRGGYVYPELKTWMVSNTGDRLTRFESSVGGFYPVGHQVTLDSLTDATLQWLSELSDQEPPKRPLLRFLAPFLQGRRETQ